MTFGVVGAEDSNESVVWGKQVCCYWIYILSPETWKFGYKTLVLCVKNNTYAYDVYIHMGV